MIQAVGEVYGFEKLDILAMSLLILQKGVI